MHFVQCDRLCQPIRHWSHHQRKCESSFYSLSSIQTFLHSLYDPILKMFYFFSQQTIEAWRTVFLLGASALVLSNTFYLVFASAEVQPWNEDGSKDKREKCSKQVEAGEVDLK